CYYPGFTRTILDPNSPVRTGELSSKDVPGSDRWSGSDWQLVRMSAEERTAEQGSGGGVGQGEGCSLLMELCMNLPVCLSGGRMSTSRPPDSTSHSADLGAQYITATPAYAQSHSKYVSLGRF
ncbi:hypothetical protein GOODEAATRI_004674, partial [Goodea atripinnis]